MRHQLSKRAATESRMSSVPVFFDISANSLTRNIKATLFLLVVPISHN